MKKIAVLSVVFLAWVASTAQLPMELFQYLQDTAGKSAWEVRSVTAVGAGEITEIRLRSQTWRGIPWDHVLTICHPGKVLVEDVFVLYVCGDHSQAHALLGLTAATLFRLRVAILSGVPNQPLFGFREDALIAYTFERYLVEGEPDWPLLLPMTRSVHAAMEALKALAPKLWGISVRGFVIVGASKRGWTTYLTAATAPKQVLGIIPIVFDFLNFPAQLQRQAETLGGPSAMLKHYTARGLTSLVEVSPSSARLAWIVDPYSYRYAYTMPKLVIVGSNDPYWTVDAANLYWPALPDPKLLFVVPNAGHGLQNWASVTSSMAAFTRLVAREEPVPKVFSEVQFTAEGAVLKIKTDRPVLAARLWVAQSMTPNFHHARWEERPLNGSGSLWEAVLTRPASGYLAFFPELVFGVDELRLYTSAPARVLGP